MIKKIILKFSSSPANPLLEINEAPITVFVGPNNSGKSKILMEIHQYCLSGNRINSDVILENIEFNHLENPENELNELTLGPFEHNKEGQNFINYGKSRYNVVDRNEILNALCNPNKIKQRYCDQFVSFFTRMFNGVERIKLIEPQPIGELLNKSYDTLQVLFKDDNKRKEVRRIIFDAFKKYFVLDPTSNGQLRIRLSDKEPIDIKQERGLHDEALEFYRKSLDIALTSDGVKAFVGIITSIIAGDPRIIIIDEPEAFLHPSLSYKLGKEISSSINGAQKNIIASTHSSFFLMGCISSGVPINIIRLTYSNYIPTARVLSSEKVLKMMRHPLLRSTGVLNGLFYDYVIVTEADSDRSFYQEINERLMMFDPNNGIFNCLFLNTQNKQTIHEIMKPLREMGIPCAAIVDIDVIKEGGTVWSNLLKSAFVPPVTIDSSANSRSNLMNRFNAKDDKFKTNGGINILDDTDKESCNNLFDQLDDYGIFTVRNGELESWLKELDIKAKHSPAWLIELFEKIGDDPLNKDYIKPSTGDVWAFITKINKWLNNSTRKGIPN